MKKMCVIIIILKVICHETARLLKYWYINVQLYCPCYYIIKVFNDTFNEPSVRTVKAEKEKNDTDVTL